MKKLDDPKELEDDDFEDEEEEEDYEDEEEHGFSVLLSKLRLISLETCIACGRRFIYWGDWHCSNCGKKYPASLLKAVVDHFEYAIGLRNGIVVAFAEASIKGEFCHLSCITGVYTDYASFDEDEDWATNETPRQFERGMDIRITDIVWCCDTGHV